MSWTITPSFSFDADAQTYITAVETADGQALETATRYAINNFVIGCKQDGIWSAIKASCILAGARTLAGALVPLVGTAPTNVGGLFISGDYNRKTGLEGDGVAKHLDTNYPHNGHASQNNIHGAVYTNFNGLFGHAFFGAAVSPNTFFLSRRTSGTDFTASINQSTSNNTLTLDSTTTGLVGGSRDNPSTFVVYGGRQKQIISRASTSPSSANILIFARTNPAANFSTGRFSFYSIGESLDLALLDARVTDLINAFAAAIP